jgi:hypothetical protein
MRLLFHSFTTFRVKTQYVVDKYLPGRYLLTVI